ncbi:MAG: cell division protein ZipA C-terminal FtsZ-binding domain-containing protein [Thiolinea sp.]
METVSLIIMIVGLVAMAAIYAISRLSRQDLPKSRNLPPIQTLTGQDGAEATSIQEDQPARDGKAPSSNAQDFSDVMRDDDTRPSQQASHVPPQLIMFIAADEGEVFEGPKILEALENSGLSFGTMDVYHRMVLTENGETSLFNVASGIRPWTLVPDELRAGAQTPGLSMILNLPSPIDDREAIHDFVRTAERITNHLGGVLKNQNQEPITAEQRRAYFAMA